VLTLLDWKWSPQQIAATLKRVFPDEPGRHVSHETIYTAIYAQPCGELRRQLIACLRQGKSTSGWRQLPWPARAAVQGDRKTTPSAPRSRTGRLRCGRRPR